MTVTFASAELFRDAPCTKADPDTSFTHQGQDAHVVMNRAKKLCDQCPLVAKAECLEHAMRAEGNTNSDGRYGVFGGLTPNERAQLARERSGKPRSTRAPAVADGTPCAICDRVMRIRPKYREQQRDIGDNEVYHHARGMCAACSRRAARESKKDAAA